MLLKRKRSIDLPLTASSLLPPPPYQKAPLSEASLSRPVLNSRTQKRHRDNRPSEETIHAQTLHKLYDAQRTHTNQDSTHIATDVERANQERQDEDSELHVSGAIQKQKSLHSFWSLPSLAASIASQDVMIAGSNMLVAGNGEERCEDCDAPMRTTSTEADGDHTMSDTGMELETQARQGGGMCEGCGRRVCGLCSLVPRERRMCLECVGRGWV